MLSRSIITYSAPSALLADTPQFPHYEREGRPSKLDPYKHYISERVAAAAPEWIPATVLLRERFIRYLRASFYLPLASQLSPEGLKVDREPPTQELAVGCVKSPMHVCMRLLVKFPRCDSSKSARTCKRYQGRGQARSS